MRARWRREWLQKHPTPRVGNGDFHWYPASVDAGARAEIAEGATGDVVVWLAPGRVVLARRFGEVAPGDGRRYAGIAAIVVEGDGASAAALCAAALVDAAAARPWDGDEAHGECEVREPGAYAICDADAGLAGALWRGGVCCGGEVEAIAALETWLPETTRASARRVVIDRDARVAPARGAGVWLARAAAAGDFARWASARALAQLEARAFDDLLDELDACERAWASAAGVRAYLAGAGATIAARDVVDGDGAAQWARALHAWGRGRGVRAPLDVVLARRAVIDGRWRAALRWHALLPRARADELEAAMPEVLRGEA